MEDTYRILSFIALLAPLAASITTWLIAPKHRRSIATLSILWLAGGFASAFILFSLLRDGDPIVISNPWFTVGDHTFTADLALSTQSLLMLVVVSLISLLVHIYSTVYMAGDANWKKYFAMLGFFIAGVLGSALGLLIGLFSTFRQVVGPWVNAAYATPMTMFIPIIGMYFGLGMGSQVFLVVTFCIFSVLMNTAEGVQAVPTQYFELAKTMGISKPAAVFRIVIPFALPYVFVGLRISVASAFAGAITAELLFATEDLGLMIMTASVNFEFV